MEVVFAFHDKTLHLWQRRPQPPPSLIPFFFSSYSTPLYTVCALSVAKGIFFFFFSMAFNHY